MSIDIIGTTSCNVSIATIADTECIGASLTKINNNFAALKAAGDNNCRTLSEVITAVEAITTVPIGTIVIWTGETTVPVASITSGTTAYIRVNGVTDTSWAVCTGATVNSKLTPNLIAKFVYGAGNDGTTTYTLSATGGAKEVTLTTANLPSHSHGNVVTNVSLSKHTENSTTSGPGTFLTGTTSISVSKATTTAGSSTAHQNLPPYFVLYYIMKVA